MREATSKHYGPRVYSHASFTSPLLLCFVTLLLSVLTWQTIYKGLTTPSQRWEQAFVFVQDLEILLHWIDTLVLKLREILTTIVLHHPFRFEGTPTQGSKAMGEILCILA